MCTEGVAIARSLSGQGGYQLFDMRVHARKERCTVCEKDLCRPVISHLKGERCPTKDRQSLYINPSVRAGHSQGVRNNAPHQTEKKQKKRAKKSKKRRLRRIVSSESESDHYVDVDYKEGAMSLCKAFDGIFLCQLTENVDVEDKTVEIQFWNRQTQNDKFFPSWVDENDGKEMFLNALQAAAYERKHQTVLAKTIHTVNFCDLLEYDLKMDDGFPPAEALRKICNKIKHKKKKRTRRRKR